MLFYHFFRGEQCIGLWFGRVVVGHYLGVAVAAVDGAEESEQVEVDEGAQSEQVTLNHLLVAL